MDGELLLAFLSRWLHILGAITLAGGTIFMRFALLPALAEQPGEIDLSVRAGVVRRWRLFVHSMIGVILLTGCYNFFARFAEVKPMPYHALFGLKLIIGMVVFFLASALVGSSRGLQPLRDKAKTVLTINAILAVILVLIGGLMRIAPLKPTVPTAQSPSALVRPVATSNSANSGISIAAHANP